MNAADPYDVRHEPALIAAVRWSIGVDSPAVTLHDDHAAAVVAYAAFDRITPSLAGAIADGVVVAGAETQQQITQAWHDALVGCVQVEAMAVGAVRVLDEAGVAWRATKGLALAHLDYAPPQHRTFGDADLVVKASDWERAMAALGAAGFVAQAGSYHGSFVQRYGKGVTLADERGLELDLHRRLAIGRFGVSAQMDDLFSAPADRFVLADTEMSAPPIELRLMHACYHAALGGFAEMRAFMDVGRLGTSAALDLDRLAAVAHRWQARAVVAAAVAHTWERFSLDPEQPLHRWAAAQVTSAADRRALQVFAERHSFRRQALTAVGKLPYIQRPGYVSALLGLGWRRRRSGAGTDQQV